VETRVISLSPSLVSGSFGGIFSESAVLSFVAAVGGPSGPKMGIPWISPSPGLLLAIKDFRRIAASLVELIRVSLASSCSGITEELGDVIMLRKSRRSSLMTAKWVSV
jgi:hypothetical protein